MKQITNFTLRKIDKKVYSSVSGLFILEYPSQVIRRFGLDKITSYSYYQTYGSPLKGFNPRVKAIALIKRHAVTG